MKVIRDVERVAHAFSEENGMDTESVSSIPQVLYWPLISSQPEGVTPGNTVVAIWLPYGPMPKSEAVAVPCSTTEIKVRRLNQSLLTSYIARQTEMLTG